MYSKKKRRMKGESQSSNQENNELPWELHAKFDPTFLPTSLYKSAFAASWNVQKMLEPYSFDNMSNANATSKIQPKEFKSKRITSDGCRSARLPSSPHIQSHFNLAAGVREASNTITQSPNTSAQCSFTGKTDVGALEQSHRPIGVFWDIENCSVPRGRSALVAVQRIREKFFVGHLEAEFVCVCDIRKEAPAIIQELNDAQVSVVHVAGNSKNAADDKLRQSMRRFADISCSNPVNSSSLYPATVVLISGDINFAADLYDLRYRKRLYVILLHNKQTPEALLLCAHEQYEFHSILINLPNRAGYKDIIDIDNNSTIPLKGGLNHVDVLVTDLPLQLCHNHNIKNFVRNRLRKLSENCGGKVHSIGKQSALIRFPNQEAALRASKRMNGEDVFGYKIRTICDPHTTIMGFNGSNSGSNFQAQLFVNEEEDVKTTGFKSDHHQGIFSSSPSWKPTWRRNNGSEGFHNSARSRTKDEERGRYNLGSTTAQSNSSTPNETSRDNSPNVLKSQNMSSASDSTTVLHLNNAVQYQPVHPVSSMSTGTLNVASGSQFAFHQNLFPSFEYSNLHQESQIPLQHSENPMPVPRLYSIPSDDTNNSAAAGTSNNFKMHFAAGPKSGNVPFSIRNEIPIAHSQVVSSASTMMDSPLFNSQLSRGIVANNSHGYFSKSKISDGGESFDLNVTNIDPSIGDWKAIRIALLNAFSEHVYVRHIWVLIGNDGSASAVVRLNNKEDAHYAVAQLHRRKVGNKRIFISFHQGQSVDFDCLKMEVASLLQDVPNNTVPLFKFREMFEKRYRRSISSNDLYRMKDVVQISETLAGTATQWSGRSISLTRDWKNKQDGKGLDLYCKLHPPKARKASESPRMGWAEKEAEVMLPNVVIELKDLKAKVHALLQSHDGSFPLISFLDCYEAEFGPLQRAPEGQGVPLEHLISCIQGVSLIFAENGMKRIQWHEKKDIDHHGAGNPTLANQLTQFGRELVDLLKTFPKCTLPFAKLIPSYHTHFGRQCRVADYGHFSLSALLQTLPHVVQVMGAAQNRVLTLSHRAQMKRFATDLLRVLKSQGGPKKQIRMDDFPEAFKSIYPQRQFQPEDYGLCYFSDLISELVENTTLVAMVKDEDGNIILAVPKREQTPQEILKTRIFASEVVELLRHSTRCELEFSKFVPYYHHHFQKQCKVSDYGFSKLVELFDAISDTVLILSPTHQDCSTEDKIIRLTPKEQIKVVGEQVTKIVEKRKAIGIKTLVSDLLDCFLEEHGFFLRPELCGAETIEDLVYNKLDNYVKVESEELIPVDRMQIEDIAQRAESILQNAPDYKMELEQFLTLLNEKYEDYNIDPATIEKDLDHILLLKVTEDMKRVAELSPLRIFASEITSLLEANDGTLPLTSVENSYLEKFGKPLRPAQLGFPTVLPMLQAISDVVSIKGKIRTKRLVVLNSSKAALESSTSDESSGSSYGKQTPRSHGSYRKAGNSRRNSSGSGSGGKRGKTGVEWNPANRNSAPPLSLFSPIMSPAFSGHASDPNVFTFDHGNLMSPPIYDTIWMPEPVGPGSPPVSPPVVWTCHPIFYPSSPPAGGAGNILMTSPYVTHSWNPPAVASAGCMPHGQATSPTIEAVMGNDFILGQNRLAASFQGLSVDTEA